MATLIGLCLRVKLQRSLPRRFKVSVSIERGKHASEVDINKQLADKVSGGEEEWMMGDRKDNAAFDAEMRVSSMPPRCCVFGISSTPPGTRGRCVGESHVAGCSEQVLPGGRRVVRSGSSSTFAAESSSTALRIVALLSQDIFFPMKFTIYTSIFLQISELLSLSSK
jgi:hypothetical protein